MNGIEYQSSAMRTNDHKATYRLEDKLDMIAFFKEAEKDYDLKTPAACCDLGGVLNGCLGLSGEVGEFNDMIKKWIFHEKDMDFDHAMKELGDICWYIAMICESFGWNLDVIMQMNIDKLKARYPEGFDVNRSADRAANDV